MKHQADNVRSLVYTARFRPALPPVEGEGRGDEDSGIKVQLGNFRSEIDRSGTVSVNAVYRPEPTSHQRRLPGQLTREFTALLADTAGDQSAGRVRGLNSSTWDGS